MVVYRVCKTRLRRIAATPGRFQPRATGGSRPAPRGSSQQGGPTDVGSAAVAPTVVSTTEGSTS